MDSEVKLTRVAIVVIGHNEGERLTRCLESVLLCDWPVAWRELIYVDSFSSDDSCRRARHAGARVLKAGRRGAAAARNTGLRATRADWVLFLDGDTVLDPGFIRKALVVLQREPDIAGVWGQRRELAPRQSAYVRVLDLDWHYHPGDTQFCGGDALFRRGALEEVGGFNPNLMAGEEPELCYRLRRRNWRITHINVAMTQHDLAIVRFHQYWRRAVRAGYAYAAVSRYTGSFWRGEVQHALRQAGIVLLLSLLSVLLLWRGTPALAAVPWLALLALMLRSAWRARWRSRDPLTLLLYGVHSWFEQLPICLGIWSCWQDQRQLRSQPLIDYKRSGK